jgi:CRISPR-associated protein Cmr3
MNIFIEPSDVWLFRDGRPFAPNERGRAVSLFPPTPRTMQGVIRSARIAQSGASFVQPSTWPDDVGTSDTLPESFQLRGPLVGRRSGGSVQRFFPLPQDVTKLQSGWHILSPRADDMKTGWPNSANLLPLLPPAGSDPVKFEAGWLCEDGLLGYLKGNVCGVHVHPNTDLFLHEPRFGVQIDSHPKRPMEGMLYQVEFVRLREQVGLLIEVEGINLNGQGLLQLGGEARAGRYETVTPDFMLPPEGRLSNGEKRLRFKLYFATPALFKKGWLPGDIHFNGERFEGNWSDIHLTLIAAAIGKPQSIGGRDIARRDQQRSMYRGVPAGSVYFFETSASASDVLAKFDGECVSDLDAQIGFGLTYIGGWNHV